MIGFRRERLANQQPALRSEQFNDPGRKQHTTALALWPDALRYKKYAGFGFIFQVTIYVDNSNFQSLILVIYRQYKNRKSLYICRDVLLI